MRRGALPAIVLLFALGALHFHGLANFTRPLLDYDDTEFIAPLDGMSLGTYVNDWATKPDHYIFPLRDLTFAVDFRLSRALHAQTFWLVNFAIFLGTMLAIWRSFALYYRERPVLVVGWVGVLALHPLNVHMVEWLSNRKHLLVVLILGWATWRALKQHEEQATPTARDFVVYFAAYLAAWLCFPTGMLWIFWLLLLFHKKLAATKRRALTLWGLALVIAAAGYHLTVAANTSYQSKAGVETSPLRFTLASTGRAVFNLLLPLRLEPYYRLGDAREWLGLGLLLVLVGLAGYRLLKVSSARRQLFLHLVLLAVALYLPNAKVFLGYTEYVWSDRYLYGSLPFLVLAALVLLVEPGSVAAGKGRIARWLGPTAAVVVALAYLVLGFRLVPRWQNGRTLFETCSREERSAKCVAMAVEKNFDQGGCALLPELLELAHRIAPAASNTVDHSFQAEVPVYDALCIASEMRPPAEKLREIERLRGVYTMPDFLVLGRILVHLQLRDIAAARAAANATYFDPVRPMPNASTKIINMMRGQGEALCQLAELVEHDRTCWSAFEIFRARVQQVVVKPKQTEWTFTRTLNAFNTGQ
jgi:hypothetical protein